MSGWEDGVGDGWKPIVIQAVGVIEANGGKIFQVKEKFGGLRIYSHGGDRDIINETVRWAEASCEDICEYCGKPGKKKNRHGWIKTLCEEC